MRFRVQAQVLNPKRIKFCLPTVAGEKAERKNTDMDMLVGLGGRRVRGVSSDFCVK